MKAFVQLTVILVACAGEASVQPVGERPREGVEEMLGGALLPDHHQKKLIAERALARELETTLEALGGVERARVHLTLPDDSLLSRDREAPGEALVVLVVSGANPPSRDRVAGLVAAAQPGIEQGMVKVELEEAGDPGQGTVKVGPIEVAEGSAVAAKVLLAGLLGICMILAMGLIYAGVRIRKARAGSGQRDVEPEPGVGE